MNIKYITANFQPITVYYWIPEDEVESVKFYVKRVTFTVYHLSLGTLLQELSLFLQPWESSLFQCPHLHKVPVIQHAGGKPKTKELPGRAVWLLINSSNLGLFLCCMVGNPRTFMQEWLKNKTTTTNNDENLQFFDSWQSIGIYCFFIICYRSLY